jgi:hypothetical protein
MPQGTPSTKPLSYVGSSCACYISRFSSVARPSLKRKIKNLKFSILKKTNPPDKKYPDISYACWHTCLKILEKNLKKRRTTEKCKRDNNCIS